MLRKRNRSNQKNQTGDGCFPCDPQVQKHRTSPIFGIPSLFVGLNSKTPSEPDAARSPISSLDFRILSKFGCYLKSPRDPEKNSVGCKVGLGIIDYLDGPRNGKFLQSSDSVVFGPKMKIRTPVLGNHLDFSLPNTLAENFFSFLDTRRRNSTHTKSDPEVVFEIGESFGKIQSFSLESGRPMQEPHSLYPILDVEDSYCNSGVDCIVKLAENSDNLEINSPKALSCPSSAPRIVGPLSECGIELSEDYTCVISHGANPTITHIFGDCVLVSQIAASSDSGRIEFKIDDTAIAKGSRFRNSFPCNDFLSLCYFCKKELDGKDIYMYRGEKAFCSLDCRTREILNEEEVEKAVDDRTKYSGGIDFVEVPFQIGMPERF